MAKGSKHLYDGFNQNKIQPTSMIDISDGLCSELNHISKATGLGYKIFESKIPIQQETKNEPYIQKTKTNAAALLP